MARKPVSLRAPKGEMRPVLPGNDELFGVRRPAGRTAYDDVVISGGGREDTASTPEEAVPVAPPEKGVLAYAPTRTIDPDRPRTAAAYYNPEDQVITIRFREGARYAYYDVPPNIWKNFRAAKSPGRYINRVLNGYRYGPTERIM